MSLGMAYNVLSGAQPLSVCMPLNTVNIDLKNMIRPEATNCFSTASAGVCASLQTRAEIEFPLSVCSVVLTISSDSEYAT